MLLKTIKNLTNKDIEGYLREIKNNTIEYSDVFEKIRIKD